MNGEKINIIAWFIIVVFVVVLLIVRLLFGLDAALLVLGTGFGLIILLQVISSKFSKWLNK